MYESVDADGKRPDTVADLARHLGVSRPTVYAALHETRRG
jgi:Mn-dependent DtxR family transcriptional regulator